MTEQDALVALVAEFWEDVPILTQEGEVIVNADRAADLHAMGLLSWDEAGNWHSRLTKLELLRAVEGL